MSRLPESVQAVDSATGDAAGLACPLCGQVWANPGWMSFMDERACGFCVNGFVMRRVLAYVFDAMLWGSGCGGASTLLLAGLFDPQDSTLALGGFFVGPCLFMTTPVLFGSIVENECNDLTSWLVAVGLFLLVNFTFLLKDSLHGASPGKWLMGLRVVDRASLEPATWRQSIRRNLILLIPGYVGHIAAACTLKRRARAGEESADTTVIWHRYRFSRVFSGGRFCRACGYDLTGNVSGRCPECGAERLSLAPSKDARTHGPTGA